MVYFDRALKVLNALPALIATSLLAVCETASAATSPNLVISYPTGSFSSLTNNLTLFGHAAVSGTSIEMTPNSAAHITGYVWATSQQNIQSFTSKFSFQMTPNGANPSIQGMTFTVQNSTTATNPDGYFGLGVAADANLNGYGAYPGQDPVGNSVAIKFDLNPYAYSTYPNGGVPSATGLYINGGPLSQLLGESDLTPYGINLYSGHVFSANVVYDGTLLTMTLLDTTTNAQGRYVWPVNIPAVTQSNNAWVGFTASEVNPANQYLLSWTFATGYATRLATPTFSVAPGQYTSTQSVSLGCPSGATCYYTTNGLLPTTSATQYTGTPISVSSNEVIQAVAVESGYTDSLVAAGNYQIQAASAPLLNFASFANPNGLIQLAGHSAFSNSAIQLTDRAGGFYSNGTMEVSSAWYAVPVNISTFSTAFTYQATSSAAANEYGIGTVFVIQNQPQTTPTAQYGFLSGGTTYVGNASTALGYGPQTPTSMSGTTGGMLNSVGVKLDASAGSNGSTGLYTNGVLPSSATSPDIPITGVNLNAGNPITVAFTYNGSTLSMTLTDTVTNATFSHSWTINIPSTVGANTAYIGFTAASSYWSANQYIKSWTYSTSATSTSSTGSTGSTTAVPDPPTNVTVQ
jgi:hypothetical protein